MLRPRVWIKDDEVMSLIEVIFFNKMNKQVAIKASSFIYYFDEVIFMQNTTLKDVNGKYIYEGDIVRSTYSTKELFVVRYDLSKGWRIDNNRLGLRLYNYRHEIEVVGNIFENTELYEEGSTIDFEKRRLENE